MEVNLLNEFRKNVSQIQFNPKIKDSYLFDYEQIDFAIKILKDFFSEKTFIIDQKITHIDNSGLKANENWIIYHLAQSKHSIGSILLIFEITCLIHYFSNSETDKKTLQKKLKKKNGEINEKEIRSSLFELYSATILEKAGFKIEIDDNSNLDKPLDIIIKINDKRIIVECKTINETEIENNLIDIVSFCTNSYFKLIEENQINHNVLRYLPASLFWVVKDKLKINDAKNCFKNLLQKYQSDIQKVANGVKQIEVPYKSPNDNICLMNIEPYKTGLFEGYSDFFKMGDTGVKFKLFPRKTNQDWELAQEIECKYTPKPIEERIKDAIENKKKQHKNSVSDKIYFLEYENYTGFRTPINLNSVSLERIKGLLNENETVCIIHKDSTQQDSIKRKLILISKNGNNSIIHKLKIMEMNPFVMIK